MEMDIVDSVVEMQNRHGYTDQQMADIIGCSRPTYQRTRTRKIPAGGVFLRGAGHMLSTAVIRLSVVNRETTETNISLELNIDGSGQWEINTGIKMFDHLLAQVVRHGRFDLKVTATGDDQHHVAEDVALCLGKAFNQALADKQGIIRMGDATVPMDDALATVAVDISGRGYTVLELSFSDNDMTGFSTDLIRHFLESLALEARINLHAKVISGINDHHKAEALFKALGRALDMATRIDERMAGGIPSTKELLEG